MTVRDIRGSVTRLWRVFRSKGIRHLVRSGADKVMAKPLIIKAHYRYYRILRSRRKFLFRSESYPYFYHMYNHTWKNERTVEVPIVWKMVREHPGKPILEIGNVLSHYFPVDHEIVDKFEKGPGVINEDVVDFRSSRRYDLIVTISTLEHVGWDEDPTAKSNILAEPTKIIKAIENLTNHLSPGGKLVVTVPLGLNPQLDRSLSEGKIPFSERYCLKRVSGSNKWREVDWADCKSAEYGSPYKFANAVVIGIISRP
jgi:hypothetical protein